MLNKYDNVESSHVEFKENLEMSKPKSWLKSVSAFANTEGGFIVFGIRDYDLEPVGLSNIKDVSEKITTLINDKIKPIPSYNITPFTYNNKDFLEVEVKGGAKTPYYYENDGQKQAFVRSGNSSITAPQYMLNNLIIAGQNTSFDELASKYSLKDVSFTLLSATLKKETRKPLEENDYLSLNLVNESEKVTNAGVIFSDQGYLRQSAIFCTRWKGISKGSIDGDALDDKEFYGSIISLLLNAEDFVKNNSKLSWDIVGMKRAEHEDYPSPAVREAIVNAIVHRDYAIGGSEIHIDMYDDKLEISSPGGMIDGTLIQNVNLDKVPSKRRNKVISDIFDRLNYMERRGSGLKRIVSEYDDFEYKPTFTSTNSTFIVTLPNKGYNQNENATSKVILPSIETISEEDYFILKMHKLLPENISTFTYNTIIKLFRLYSFKYEFKRENLISGVGVKKAKASEIIKVLLDYGLIEQSGPAQYRFKK